MRPRAVLARALLGLAALALPACAGASAGHAPGVTDRERARVHASAMSFLASAERAWPTPDAATRLVLATPADTRVAIYDNALMALLFVRYGRREEAGRILEALARLQRDDGAIPFSFRIDEAMTAPRYVRAGALAWVGYAAAVYLDADRDGPSREAIVRMAHHAAEYLLAHQIATNGDPRDGLIRGGEGTLEYVASGRGRAIVERFVPGDVTWASVEHNVDSFFFLRALGRLTGDARYAAAASKIAAGLRRTWDGEGGQMRQGMSESGPSPGLALDCASWGALFHQAAGEATRAETALAVADVRYASRDPKSGVLGHKPYARGPILENRVLAEHFQLPASDWTEMRAVWPEGSAGVALAALRLGHRERAAAILDQLEALRGPSGGLPTFTMAIPYTFDTAPSVAGTAWVEIVRDELARPELPQLLWPQK